MRLTAGTFGWADLLTTNVPLAKDFYAGLFGWSYEDIPTSVGVDYTMCYVEGEMVCGLGPQPPDLAAAGVPPVWNSYILVDDADAAAAAVEGAGGRVVMPPMDVMASGRMVMIAGPDGAVVGAWQPFEHQGAEVFDRPGAITWNELQSRDLSPSRDFLSAVFGWTWERQPGDMEYWVAHIDAITDDIGGAMNMPDGVPAEAPSMWVVYFGVEDCDTAAAKVDDLGGHLFLPPMDMGPGRFAGATDPSDAMFFFGSFPDPA